MKNVVVLGGGFAGLAAAVKLTELGHSVTLVERRRQLGGRAFSFTDPTTGDTVDNGQHLFMKCYHATLALLQSLGAHDEVEFQNEFQIEFRHPQKGTSTLRIAKTLPRPLNVLAGFLRFKSIGLSDVLKLRNIKPELSKQLPLSLSVAQWLEQCKQTQRLQENFWNPLCLAALNEPTSQASARYMQAVLREGFFGSPDGAFLGYSRLGLSNLLSARSQTFLNKHEQKLLLGLSAKRIDSVSTHEIAVHLSDNTKLTPDAIICAIPPQALSSLLTPHSFPELLQKLSLYRPSPILSVNLWYDRPCLDVPFIGMLGTQMEWAFNKHHLYQTHDHASPGHITLLASAAHALSQSQPKDLIELAQQEFESVAPSASEANLQHARVICERKATQTLPLGESPPNTHTNHPKLLLAGDWVNTGLPATIESAVRSGFCAANSVDKK
ncbi:MAG: FAD-dependent oxidoreductase [Candidatus Latescibacteria bacterium]|nr:FAD-dependent oxidoreductase [Candidatus Latescibacterota bacterium]